jgi:4-hydroxythreonine-4-phosphate dehydrogenase
VLASTLGREASPGRPDPANARYVLATIDAAADGCLAGRFDAMVTAPVQKSSINDAGIPFPGPHRIPRRKERRRAPVMLLVAGTLRVALATTHLPLVEVSRHLTRESLEQTLVVLERACASRFASSSRASSSAGSIRMPAKADTSVARRSK